MKDDMTPNRSARRWIRVGIVATLVTAAATTAVWMHRHASDNTGLVGDCARVDALGHQWRQMTVSVSKTLDGDNTESIDPTALVDQESAMSAKLRRAADSVSSPEIREPLIAWADAASAGAQAQRAAADLPYQETLPSDTVANFKESSSTIDSATRTLTRICPGLENALRGN